uniref:Aspartyl aminopeptidase n=1 Tax=Meloidogyne incognita TaxID=6306 RepID=A0A914L3U7_MELIC
MASVGKAVSKDVKQQIRTSALAFLSFLNKSVTPFHAVESCESILRSAGFVELFVNQRLKVQPKGKFYIKSEKRTCIFAFALGGALKSTSTGYSIVVAHTDRFFYLYIVFRPCLRVKPISKRTSEQFLQAENFIKGFLNLFE